MKKQLFSFLLGTSLILMFSFANQSTEVKQTTAEVSRLNGMAVFIESESVMEYDVLGDVKYDGTFGVTGQYQEVRDALIKKAKKKHKDANGIIIRFCNECTDRADVIKFKISNP
jgi:hypothetical protein